MKGIFLRFLFIQIRLLYYFFALIMMDIMSDETKHIIVAQALFSKGVTLNQHNRSEEEIAVYDDVVKRFGEATEPGLREKAVLASRRVKELRDPKSD